MEIKTLEELMQPDRRTTAFGPLGLMTDRVMKTEAAARFIQSTIAEYDLRDAVPEDVRGYFETARKLHTYGLFVYEFFTLAADRALFACELALRMRHAEAKSGVARAPSREGGAGFSYLLKWSSREGLCGGERSGEHLLTLAELRNFAAHPKMNRIVSPADSARMIETAAWLINGLWIEHDVT
jgi:hypothetical protein